MKHFINSLLVIAAFFAKLLYIAYLKTIRVQVINETFSPQHMLASSNAIYVSWHSKTFLAIPVYRNQNLGILTLLDWKNRFYDYMSRFLGFQTVRVTSRPRATLALVQLLKKGSHIAIAVDGPYGPQGVVKPGASYLARKTGKPIVPARIEIEKSSRLAWRWDKYEIPLPFTKATISFGEPIYATDSSDDVESKIKKALGPY